MTHPHDNPVRAELQSLDQRRADTLADALRPDAAPTDACETRRAVDCHGTVYAVTVTRREGNRPRWEILCPTAPHPAARHYLIPAEYITTADDALRRWAGRALHLLAPGEATTAEQLAAVTARADAAERERDAATARVAALTKDRDDNVDELVNCLAEREDDRRQASDALGHLRIRAEIAETERAAARRECDALRAIVEGRTAPPSGAEIAAHEAAGARSTADVVAALGLSRGER